jgi:hypothetical protein
LGHCRGWRAHLTSASYKTKTSPHSIRFMHSLYEHLAVAYSDVLRGVHNRRERGRRAPEQGQGAGVEPLLTVRIAARFSRLSCGRAGTQCHISMPWLEVPRRRIALASTHAGLFNCSNRRFDCVAWSVTRGPLAPLREVTATSAITTQCGVSMRVCFNKRSSRRFASSLKVAVRMRRMRRQRARSTIDMKTGRFDNDRWPAQLAESDGCAQPVQSLHDVASSTAPVTLRR